MDFSDLSFEARVPIRGHTIKQHKAFRDRFTGQSREAEVVTARVGIEEPTRHKRVQAPTFLRLLNSLALIRDDPQILTWCDLNGSLFYPEDCSLSNFRSVVRESVYIRALLRIWKTGIDDLKAFTSEASDTEQERLDPVDRLAYLLGCRRKVWSKLNLKENASSSELVTHHRIGAELSVDKPAEIAYCLLWKHVTPRLKGNFVSTPGAKARLSLGIRPENLYAYIWFGVAIALHKGEPPPTCEICGDPVERERATLYCENGSCKTHAANRRRDRAEELLRSGKEPQEVKKEIDNDRQYPGKLRLSTAKRLAAQLGLDFGGQNGE